MALESVEFGTLSITHLSDGHTVMPNAVFPDFDPQRAAAAGEDSFVLPISAFLIRGVGQNLLVDTGSRDNFGPDAGRFPASFAATGLPPAEVDAIFLTHLHSDHYGGLLDAQGGAAFPNARLIMTATEWRSVNDPEAIAGMSDDDRASLRRVHAAIAPYGARMVLVEDGQAVIDGVAALALPGHTAGHCGLEMRHGGQGLLVVGDLCHSPAYQVPNPGWSVIYDDRPDQAAATRTALFARAAQSGAMLAGAHFGPANFATIKAQTGGFRLG